MANDVAAILRGQYGSSTIDESAFSLQGSNYVTLEGLVGTSPNADFGNSQRMVVRSLFAFGASMENATFSSIANMYKGAIPLKETAINDTSNGSSTAGVLAGWVIVPTLVKVFVSMDIYLLSFFSGTVYFALLLFLIIMMGSAMVKQIHEGKLDIVSWIGKGIFSILCMFKANMLCNYILAMMIGLAAAINSSVINGITSQYGIDQWYLKVYGPQLTRNCYAVVTGTQKPAIAKAFSEGKDMYNVSRYVLYENGSATAATLCKYLGGAEGYNDSNGANSTVSGVSFKELTSTYCLMTVYNVGLNNLLAHEAMGYSDVQTDIDNFKLAIAQVYTGNDGLTVGDTMEIDQATQALTIPGGTTSWQYLANNTSDPQAAQLNAAYRQPAVVSLTTVAGVVRSRTPQSFGSTLWSTISGALSYLKEKGSQVISYIGWLPSSITTLLTQGALQQMLLGGLLVWLLLAIALCKVGVIMVTLTSPFVMMTNTSKIFWAAVKTMVYPAIYPAMLIIIMQMTSALASWIGTISGLTLGAGLILNVIPLLFGLVSIIFLPKLVKVMLSGGNVLLAQLGEAKTVALLGAAAATGGAMLAGVAGAAGTAGTAGAAAGAGAGGAAGSAGSAAGGPVMRVLTGMGRTVGNIMRAPVPATGTSVGRAAFSTVVGGVPGLIWSAMRRNKPKTNNAT